MGCKVCGAPLQGGGDGICETCAQSQQMGNTLSWLAGKIIPLAILAGLLLIASVFVNSFFTNIFAFDTINRFGFKYYKANIAHFHVDDYMTVKEGKTLNAFQEELSPKKVDTTKPFKQLRGGAIVKNEAFITSEKGYTWLAVRVYEKEKAHDLFVYVPEYWKLGGDFKTEYFDISSGKTYVRRQIQTCRNELLEKGLVTAVTTRKQKEKFKNSDDWYKVSIRGGNYRDFMSSLMSSFNRGAETLFAEKKNKKKVKKIISFYMKQKHLDMDIAQLDQNFIRKR